MVQEAKPKELQIKGPVMTPLRTPTKNFEKIGRHRNEANAPRMVALVLHPPLNLNHWMVDPEVLKDICETVQIDWGVQIHPFAMIPCIPRYFSTFSPAGSFGQTTGSSFGPGHLWGNIWLAPQGCGTILVVAQVKAALNGQKRGEVWWCVACPWKLAQKSHLALLFFLQCVTFDDFVNRDTLGHIGCNIEHALPVQLLFRQSSRSGS